MAHGEGLLVAWKNLPNHRKDFVQKTLDMYVMSVWKYVHGRSPVEPAAYQLYAACEAAGHVNAIMLLVDPPVGEEWKRRWKKLEAELMHLSTER